MVAKGRTSRTTSKGSGTTPAKARGARRRAASEAGNGGKALVIVESPAKARTINRYLGPDFVVKASMGHVRDLPEKDFGVDVAAGFTPTYQPVRGADKVLRELRKEAKKAREVYLATDLDREGEAIAWHLVEALDLPPEKVRRVVFNEITESAIREAFAHPRPLDMDKVNAQQARRILDRIVGYELSPLLWRKIAKGLSAGRVQSVAIRMIVEREREIREFVPTESWQLHAVLTPREPAEIDDLRREWSEFLTASPERVPSQREQNAWLAERQAFRAELVRLAGEALDARRLDDLRPLLEALGFRIDEVVRQPWDEYSHLGLEKVEVRGTLTPDRPLALTVTEVKRKRTLTRPPAPFTTATLQQAASTQLGFSASRTMSLAQQLYQGVEIAGEGSVGLITYMRTDSTNLSAEAVARARSLIAEKFGERYLPPRPVRYASRKGAQEAHEAIRPTDVTRHPEALKGSLTPDQWRLYDLIWRQFVACQMKPAEWDTTTVTLTVETALGPAEFRASGRVLVFDGFYAVKGVPASESEPSLPPMESGQTLWAVQLEPRQKYTSPPPRYTEASLVKALEAEGIGRPSTYATIIDTIQERGYVVLRNRRFYATPLGELVTDKLVQHFPEVMDRKFTAHMEAELDLIEEAHKDWVGVLHEFYDPFHGRLEEAQKSMEPVRSTPSEYECPDCGGPMVYRWSRNGRFLACRRYPRCKGAFSVDEQGRPIRPEQTEHTCEKCGRPMLLRESRGGKYLACSGYPECSNTIPCDAQGEPLRLVRPEDIRETCDACGQPMVVRWRGRRAFLGCSGYPACRQTRPLPPGVRLEPPPSRQPEPAGVTCERCGKPMVIRRGRRGKFVACSGYPRCRNSFNLDELESRKAAAATAPDTASPAAGDEQTGDVREADAATPARGSGEGAGDTPSAEPGGNAPAGEAAAGRAAGTSGAAGNPSENTSPAGPADQGGDGEQPAAAHAARRDGSKAQPKSDGEVPPGFVRTRTGKLAVAEWPEGPLPCPACGQPMVLRRGRFGPFFSCSQYPRCQQAANVRGEARKKAEQQMPAPARPKPIPTTVACEACGAPMVIRSSRRGQFLGCSRFPECKSTRPLPPELIGSADEGAR